jgi:hypothetical protein
MPTMVREAWTDERLDDLKERMDEGFREVKGEIRSTRAELKGEIGELRVSLNRLTYTLVAALIGLLATHYLG